MDKIRPAGDREQIGTPQSNGDKQGRAGPDEQSNVGHHPPSLSAAVHGKRRLSGLLSSSSNAPSVPLTRPVPAAAYTNPYLSPELSLSSPALLFASSSRQKSSVQSIQHQVAAMPPKPAGKDIPAFFPRDGRVLLCTQEVCQVFGCEYIGNIDKIGLVHKVAVKVETKRAGRTVINVQGFRSYRTSRFSGSSASSPSGPGPERVDYTGKGINNRRTSCRTGE